MIFIDQYKNCFTIDFRPTKSKYICPVCGDTRKNKKDRSLYINRNSHVGKCYNCDAVLFEHSEADNIVKEWKQPKELKTTISKSVIDYFAGRGISEATLNYLKVTNGLTFMPQVNAEVNTIDFNYFKAGKPINIKHRDKDKNFKFETDCEVTFYNFDAIHKFDKIIIVEGEVDALSWIEAGYHNVVSLPNGCKNIKFIDQYIFDVEKVKEWILCLDKDEGGLSARHELMCKLGIEKCKIVNTKDCKDANKYLQVHGKKELALTYQAAEFIIPNENDFDFNMMLEESEINEATTIKPYKIILGQKSDGDRIEMMTSGNLSMVQGKSKSRKTWGLMNICNLILSQTFDYFGNSDNGVILFDTEQSSNHSLRWFKRLQKLTDLGNFRMYNLRKYKKAVRLQFIINFIERFEPSVVFIDNVGDVMKNFNDVESTDEIITTLTNAMELTGTHVCCTLHENKGDGNAKGHLGSLLTQKSETVFDIKTEEEITTINGKYCRNKAFKDIQFELVNDLPVLLNSTETPF